MSAERFEHLLAMVAPLISKQDTYFRKCISVAERLALTLQFRATGDAQQSLSFSYQLGKSTVSNIISETCEAIYQCLKKRLCQSPRNTRTVAVGTVLGQFGSNNGSGVLANSELGKLFE